MTLDEQIDKILVNLDAYKIRFDDFTPEEHYALYPDLKQAKQAIKALIAEQVKQARKEEIQRFLVEPGEVIPYNNNTFAEGFSYVIDKLQDRLAELDNQ